MEKCDTNGQITLQFGIRGDSGNTAISTRQVTFAIYTPSVDNTNKNTFSPTVTPTVSERFACDVADSPADAYFGLCDYDIFPGDEKVTVANPDEFPDPDGTDTTFDHGIDFVNGSFRDTASGAGFIPEISSSTNSFNIPYTGLYVVYSDTGFNDTLPWIGFSEVLEFTAPSTSTLADDDIENLANGVTYYFRAGTLDIAQNVSMLFGDDVINAYCNLAGDSTIAEGADSDGDGFTDVEECPFAAKPQLVVGLISENKCFITTATYGSSQAYQVKLFRKFREKFLWTNSLGLLVSRTYNAYGPFAAKWIYKNPWSKSFVRAGLYPLYWFAFSSLRLVFS